MSNIFRSILRLVFNHNSNENENNNNNNNDDDPRPKRLPDPTYYDDDEMQRAIEESKREFEVMKNAEKQKKNQKEMEDMEALQYNEIQSVVFDNTKLIEILKKLPGVNPDDRIFNEFYFNDTNY